MVPELRPQQPIVSLYQATGIVGQNKKQNIEMKEKPKTLSHG